jgi:alginate O-acetyltransferase complex protein AlgI
LIVYWSLRAFSTGKSVRNIVLLAANLLLLLYFIKEHSFIVISGLGVGVYLIGIALRRSKSKALLTSAIFVLVLMFIIRNYPIVYNIVSQSWFQFINGPILSVQKVGISYILFRMIHFLVDNYSKAIIKSDLPTFLNYLTFFPSFLAGPIDKYQNFHYYLHLPNKPYFKHLAMAGITRITLGAFKSFILVGLVLPYALNWNDVHSGFGFLMDLIFNLLAYSVYIYLDFSGYSDIAIGTAYLFGVKSPENFNSPYLSTNLSEFWKRWHITFSSFLKQYIFKPTLALLNFFMPKAPRLVITVLGYLITFAICGIWHGNTIDFVYWGLWHGLGLGINKIWVTYNAKHALIAPNNAYKFSSFLLTFIFVTIGWMWFNYSNEQLVVIFKNLMGYDV